MKKCYSYALLVRELLQKILDCSLEEHSRYLERCEKSGSFFLTTDRKFSARETELNEALNLQRKVILYLERTLGDLDSDFANIAYEDIDNMEDYDYTAG